MRFASPKQDLQARTPRKRRLVLFRIFEGTVGRLYGSAILITHPRSKANLSCRVHLVAVFGLYVLLHERDDVAARNTCPEPPEGEGKHISSCIVSEVFSAHTPFIQSAFHCIDQRHRFRRTGRRHTGSSNQLSLLSSDLARLRKYARFPEREQEASQPLHVYISSLLEANCRHPSHSFQAQWGGPSISARIPRGRPFLNRPCLRKDRAEPKRALELQTGLSVYTLFAQSALRASPRRPNRIYAEENRAWKSIFRFEARHDTQPACMHDSGRVAGDRMPSLCLYDAFRDPIWPRQMLCTTPLGRRVRGRDA